jgi:hypothetical protein
VITVVEFKTLTFPSFLSFSSHLYEERFYELTNLSDDGSPCLAIHRHRVPKIEGFDAERT